MGCVVGVAGGFLVCGYLCFVNNLMVGLVVFSFGLFVLTGLVVCLSLLCGIVV